MRAGLLRADHPHHYVPQLTHFFSHGHLSVSQSLSTSKLQVGLPCQSGGSCLRASEACSQTISSRLLGSHQLCRSAGGLLSYERWNSVGCCLSGKTSLKWLGVMGRAMPQEGFIVFQIREETRTNMSKIFLYLRESSNMWKAITTLTVAC